MRLTSRIKNAEMTEITEVAELALGYLQTTLPRKADLSVRAGSGSPELTQYQ
jgi:hypothetical protein